MKKLFSVLFLCTVLLCGCSGNGEEISETAAPPASSADVTTETSARAESVTTTTAAATAEETAAVSEAAAEYKYAPPAAAFDVEFARDNIICRVDYQYYPNDETADLPEYIFSDINSYANEFISNAEDDYTLERIGVYMFDINSDGIDDYIVIGEIEKNEPYYPYIIEKLYIQNGNGGFNVVDFPASCGKDALLYDRILSTKTNGYSDFIGSSHNGILLISFDGNNTYSEAEILSAPYNQRWEYLDNDLAKITIGAPDNEHKNEIAVAKFFYDTDRAEHMLLYSSLPDGTPSSSIIGKNGYDVFEFYVKRTDKAPERWEDWGVGPIEVKFIPADPNAAKEEIVLTPISSDAPFEVPACDIIEHAAVNEENFPNKEIIKRAKEICFADKDVHGEIEQYNYNVDRGVFNTERYGYIKVETAEDIVFSCGMALDFDGDGSDEYMIALDYEPLSPMDGGFLVFIDGSEYETAAGGGDIAITDINLILSGGVYFPMVTYNGGTWQSTCVYSFENNKPRDMVPRAIGSGGPYNILYKDNIFYRISKYGQIYKPFVLCEDGKFRQLGREKISREGFEKHVQNGGEYLDSLAANGEEITEIYTYGYYNYELYGKGFRYDVYGNYFADNDTFITERYDSDGVHGEMYFTDEVIYGDVWAVKPARSPDAGIADELLNRINSFYYSVLNFELPCRTDEKNIKYYTEEDIMNGLCEFCTKSVAEEFFNTVSGQLYKSDGRFYSYDEAPSYFPPVNYVAGTEKKDGVITAKLFSHSFGHDIPYIFYSPIYAEFVLEDGVWKISKLPKEF